MAATDPTAPPPVAAPAPVEPPVARRRRPWLALLFGLLAVAALLLAGGRLRGAVADAARGIERLGPWAPAAFVAGYALATVALLPGSVLTLAGGALFGLWRGTLYVFAGATVGACLAFLIARHLAR
ncbi:MAG TPA: VTT domain-containing protein, partial [Thermoanaerobaculia bacterium]|nr:VTT domain-containing protein [Thermoanaerobaculia bacterium]